MKNIKRLFVVVLTLILSFGIVSAVFAEDATTNQGSITVKGTTKDKVYEVYKIFDLTYSGDNVAYTIDSDWTEFFAGTGESYIIDLEKDDNGNVINPDNLNQITVIDEDGNKVTRYINITEANVAEFTQVAFDYAAKTSSVVADKTEVALGEELTFTELALGYYLVYPQGATEKLEGYASICSITSTLPDAEVNIKATYPSIKKEVNRPSFDVGEYAEFKIVGNVPDTTGYTTYTYIINDSWTDGLDYDEDYFDMVVTVGDDNVIIDDENLELNSTNTGFELFIDVMNDEYEVGDKITVTYKLKVTEDAINSTTTHNNAYLTYSNDPKTGSTTNTTEVEVEVYSAKIEVIKVDGDNTDIKLEGAKFVLKNKDGEYYKATTIISEETKEELTLVTWVLDFEDATVLTTDQNGVIIFEGIEDGTYYLEEIEAPVGYNKLVDVVPVTVTREVDSNDKVVLITQEVKNYTGTSLPSTGGFGTKLFIGIGSLLVGISGIILITNKRISKEN